jgi:hypothetical protein
MYVCAKTIVKVVVMENKNLNEFVKQYHRAVVLALGKDLKTTNAKIGSILAEQWAASQKGKYDTHKFADAYQQYLQQFGFADTINVRYTDTKCEVDIKGCAICPGNELLRREKKETMCPIIKATSYALLRETGKNVKTDKPQKNGVVGECTLKYKLI